MRTILNFLGFILLISNLPAWAFTPQDYYNAGVQYYHQKQYDKAVAYLKEAVTLDPQFWQAYQMLGTSYYQTGDLADAASAIQTSLKIHPDNPPLEKFAQELNPPSSTSAQALSTLSPAGRGEKPAPGPGAKSEHIFINILAAFEEPFSGSLNSAEKAYKSQPPVGSGFGNGSSYEPEIFGFGLEAGYLLDKENALSLCLYGSVVTSGPEFEEESYTGPPSEDSAEESIEGGVSEFGLRYYRYLPETSGRWFGFLGADYYSFGVNYSVNQSSGGYPNTSTSYTNAQLAGSTFGGSIGVGRQFDIFHFLGMEASVAFKYADVPKVTGSYTSGASPNSTTPSTVVTGQGTLVTLSNGSVVLVDQKYVGSATVTHFDLTGIEGRAAINVWF
ncbi:MAG TPA: tetratricopeptide repeat protein [bacterium]|nr:tetratricopeptide repeat protein [bacterium]